MNGRLPAGFYEERNFISFLSLKSTYGLFVLCNLNDFSLRNGKPVSYRVTLHSMRIVLIKQEVASLCRVFP